GGSVTRRARIPSRNAALIANTSNAMKSPFFEISNVGNFEGYTTISSQNLFCEPFRILTACEHIVDFDRTSGGLKLIDSSDLSHVGHLK
ncbi:MAG: hypothetical protein AAGA76_04780, partial [Pseudomonadota bacterium]